MTFLGALGVCLTMWCLWNLDEAREAEYGAGCAFGSFLAGAAWAYFSR